MSDLQSAAREAKKKFKIISNLTAEKKNNLLINISEKIKSNQDKIIEENKKDMAEAEKLFEKGEISKALLKRLELNEKKVAQLSEYLENVARLDDPVGKKQSSMELAPNLNLHRIAVPIGVVSVIFESRPEVVVQVSALALKSGNCCILKGGAEAKNSNRILFSIIDEALKEIDLSGSLVLIESRDEVKALLDLEEYIDLIIPRGSNSFVKYIQENTQIPVIGHSSGICHIYVDADYNHEQAVEIIKDAKIDYPSACNALETLLVNENIAKNALPDILKTLSDAGVELVGCEKTVEIVQKTGISIAIATTEDWQTEYGDLKLSVKVLQNIDEAIDHINQNGSHHTDSILTNDEALVEKFMNEVDSACVFHNSSTRFSDGFVFGLGAEVGISTNKTHARGPVGLEGLMSYKYKLFGKGHLKGKFSAGEEKFTHRPL